MTQETQREFLSLCSEAERDVEKAHSSIEMLALCFDPKPPLTRARVDAFVGEMRNKLNIMSMATPFLREA